MTLRKPVTVKRQSAGAYVKGVWVSGGEASLTIRASVQPASGKDMERLPEGRRLTGAVRLYTDDALYLADGDQQADRVVVGGADYEVMTADDWGNSLIPHRKYICARVV